MARSKSIHKFPTIFLQIAEACGSITSPLKFTFTDRASAIRKKVELSEFRNCLAHEADRLRKEGQLTSAPRYEQLHRNMRRCEIRVRHDINLGQHIVELFPKDLREDNLSLEEQLIAQLESASEPSEGDLSLFETLRSSAPPPAAPTSDLISPPSGSSFDSVLKNLGFFPPPTADAPSEEKE